MRAGRLCAEGAGLVARSAIQPLRIRRMTDEVDRRLLATKEHLSFPRLSPRHPDFGETVAPTQFCRSEGNDIGRCRGPSGRGRFSQFSLSLCKQSSSTDQSGGFYRHSNEVLQAPQRFHPSFPLRLEPDHSELLGRPFPLYIKAV
jgi:hypothetical protein